MQNREEAINLLEQLKSEFKSETKLYNNLGVLNTRNNETEQAYCNYSEALVLQPDSFFANYNLAVLVAD